MDVRHFDMKLWNHVKTNFHKVFICILNCKMYLQKNNVYKKERVFNFIFENKNSKRNFLLITIVLIKKICENTLNTILTMRLEIILTYERIYFNILDNFYFNT